MIDMILGWVQTERTCPSSPADHGSNSDLENTKYLKKANERKEGQSPCAWSFLGLELTESLKEATKIDV